MADALLVAVADSVAAEIAAADWGVNLKTVERSYADWDEQLPDLEGFRVDVVPVAYERVEITSRRPGKKIDLSIEIGIRRRITEKGGNGKRDLETIDSAVKLYEDLLLYFAGRAVPTVTGAYEWEPQTLRDAGGYGYDRESLRSSGLFVGVFRIKAVGLKVS